MSFGNIGVSGLILILVALLLVFGPRKLPEIGRAFGKSLREFKDATRGMMDEGARAARDESEETVHTAARVEPIELKQEVDSAAASNHDDK